MLRVGVLKKIKQIDKPLARLTKEKRKRSEKNLINERCDTKEIQRAIRVYY